jgi:Putative Flp pilus-assembly TadE/G-like
VEQPEQSPEAVSDEKAKQEGRKMRTNSSFLKDSRGSVAAITIIMMVAFFALVAIVVDLGRLMLVRGQLQNAADAGALAGVVSLVPYTANGTPDWPQCPKSASSAVQDNKADTLTLVEPQSNVQYGYWDTTLPSSQPLQSYLQTPGLGSTLCPAVQVGVQKNQANNGPVALTFGQIFGITNVNVAAHAIAIGRITAPPGYGFPMAISDEMLNTLYYTNRGSGNDFNIFSTYHTPDGQTVQAGQWTTLAPGVPGSQGVPTVENMITSPITDPSPTVSVGGLIFLQSGTEDVIYQDARALAGTPGGTILLPVVNGDVGALTGSNASVVGFIQFVMEVPQPVIKGPGGIGNKNLYGYFSSGLIPPGSLGVYLMPSLVQ